MAYNFRLVNSDSKEQIENNTELFNRPFTKTRNTFESNSRNFVPGTELETSINTALAVGSPLLLTGEPGTGKTQAAYYAAYKLNIEPVFHFQVKSDSSAGDLLYYFDAVRYFYDANLLKDKDEKNKLDKANYVEKRDLWKAFESDVPRIVLIDEIDKAPRDFPNDLLLELDKMQFRVAETQETITADPARRPIVFITSNSERRLPEPFLRRCVYHHIEFNEDLVEQAVKSRNADYENLSEDFIKLALQRFLMLRSKSLRKLPSTGEFLVWLRVLSAYFGTTPAILDDNLAKLPFLGVLLKDQQDFKDIG
jgi:MoxR-like ATPase